MEKPETPRLAGVLLAAGSSRRLGRPKQLVQLHGESLVRRAAGLLLDLGADPVVVVTGFQSKEIARELQGLPLVVVINDDWEQGMGGSIACGMRSVPLEVDGVLLMLCDQWRLDSKDLRLLKSSWITDISKIFISEWKDGKSNISGPPVIFPGQLIHELSFVNGERGAKPLIDRHRGIVSVVELNNAACDLDEPQDLDQFDEL
jgi:CTP:molybdopterin cytidylyltransferase MocA